MLALYVFRLVLMLPVLAAMAVATAVASTAGLLMRALRLFILVPALAACGFLLAPDESDAQGEAAPGMAAVEPSAKQAAPASFETAAR